MMDPVNLNPYFSIRISLSDNVQNYYRKAYSLMQLLSDIGGVQGALISIGFALLTPYSNHYLSSSIIS